MANASLSTQWQKAIRTSISHLPENNAAVSIDSIINDGNVMKHKSVKKFTSSIYVHPWQAGNDHMMMS